MIDLDIHYTRGDFKLQTRLQSNVKALGLTGASGAGKSTLLALIAGNLQPQQGTIIVNERTLFSHAAGINLAAYQRRVGVVFQDSLLFPHLSVMSNLRYGYDLLAPSARHFDITHVADLLQITPLLTRKPYQLSGGERQRVALGRAILASPDILLLDEPLSSLNESLKQQILPFIHQIKETFGVPLIYVSHSRGEINQLADVVVEMQQGQLTHIA